MPRLISSTTRITITVEIDSDDGTKAVLSRTGTHHYGLATSEERAARISELVMREAGQALYPLSKA